MRFINIVDIACGYYHNLALTKDHRMFSWGTGDGGWLGHGDGKGYNQPFEVKSVTQYEDSGDIMSIHCGDSHSAFITSKNMLYTWGMANYGWLGHGDTQNKLVPSLVSNLS